MVDLPEGHNVALLRIRDETEFNEFNQNKTMIDNILF